MKLEFKRSRLTLKAWTEYADQCLKFSLSSSAHYEINPLGLFHLRVMRIIIEILPVVSRARAREYIRASQRIGTQGADAQ